MVGGRVRVEKDVVGGESVCGARLPPVLLPPPPFVAKAHCPVSVGRATVIVLVFADASKKLPLGL